MNGIIKEMPKTQKIWLVLLRVGLGWLLFYAGLEKVMGWDGAFSAERFLTNAANFKFLYGFFASPAMLGFINFAVPWLELLLGLALMLGIFVEIAAVLSALLMLSFYFAMPFPFMSGQNKQSFIVNYQLVYALALMVLYACHAGEVWGLDAKRRHKTVATLSK